MKLKIPGVPSPTQLRRYAPGQPLVEGPVLVSPSRRVGEGRGGGRVHQAVCEVLKRAGIPSPLAGEGKCSRLHCVRPPPHAGEGGVG